MMPDEGRARVFENVRRRSVRVALGAGGTLGGISLALKQLRQGLGPRVLATREGAGCCFWVGFCERVWLKMCQPRKKGWIVVDSWFGKGWSKEGHCFWAEDGILDLYLLGNDWMSNESVQRTASCAGGNGRQVGERNQDKGRKESSCSGVLGTFPD